MICPKCGTDNPDYFVFCQNCFEELPKVEKPHKSTMRLAETPLTQFAEDPAKRMNAVPAAPEQRRPQMPPEMPQAPAPQQPPVERSAAAAIDQYTTFQQTGAVKNPEEPYLTERSYPRNPVEREAPATRFDASKRDVMPAQKPELEPLEDEQPVDDTGVLPVRRKRMPAAAEKPARQNAAYELAEESELDMFDEDAESTRRISKSQKPARVRKADKPKRRQELEKVEKPQHSDDDDYFDYYDDDDPELAREKKRGKTITIIFWLALLVLIGAVIFFVSTFAIDKYGSITEAVSQVFNIDLPGAGMQLTVEQTTTPEGEPSHTFIINGREGKALRFDDLDRQYELEAKTKKYEVPDYFWVDENPDPTVDSIVAKPKITIIDLKTNEETPLEVAEFTVSVPQASVTINTPQPSDGVSITDSVLEITGAITPTGDKGRLYINGEDISGVVSEDGTFSYTYNIEAIGPFTLELKASAARTREASVTITGERIKSEVALALSEDMVTSTESTTLPVSGTTEAGAEVSVKGAIAESAPKVDAESGAFSFTAKLDDFGVYDYVISATKDGVTSELPMTITRTPEVVSYTEKAKKLDYAKVKKNPNDNAGTAFRFDAVLVEAQTSDDGKVAYLMVVDGDSEQPVLVSYFGDAALTEGEKYTIYGSANKNSEDGTSILFNAYFVYAADV